MHPPFSPKKPDRLMRHLREDTHYTRPEGYDAMMDWYHRGLSALPVMTTSHFVETRFGLTHVLTAGDPAKPPLLLVHGINVNALNWRSQLARLSSDYYTLAPDVPGYAGRSGAWRLSYFTDDYADWLADVLDAFDIRNTAAVGSSGGGHFLLKLAAVYPQRVLGLALTNPCGIARFPLYIDLIRYQAITRVVGHVGRAFFGSPTRARFLAKTNASPGVALDPATIELAYLLSKYFRRQAPPGPLSDRQMAQINAPVLLLLSQYEPYFNITTVAREAQRKLRHAPLEVLIVPNAGHDLHNDQPDVVAGELRRWLAEIYTADGETDAGVSTTGTATAKAQTPKMQARP